jgi:superfamily I DNA/RNA helicase
VPDFRANAIEEKYESAFEAICHLADGEITKGKLHTQILQIYKDEKLSWKEDDVLCALLDLAASFEQAVSRIPFQEKARLFYNDVFIEIHWGNLLRKRVRDKVFLSTIHSVKGLQFSQVHICGLVNFGHIHRSICYPCHFGDNLHTYQPQLNQDALNMLYVGVTRAQNDLFLYAVKNAANGKSRSPICLLQNVQSFLNMSDQVDFCGQMN